MTEITLNKDVFLKTIQAFQSQFEVENPEVVLESDPGGERFVLTAKRPNGVPVKAFGPCLIKGDQFSVEFDMKELEQSIEEAFSGSEMTDVTLIIANGIWVKDPSPSPEA